MKSKFGFLNPLIFVPSILYIIQVVHRRGPWGGDGGSTHDITVAPHSLKSVKVCSAVVVDALGFSYLDRNGREHNTPLWGGVGGSIRKVRAYSLNFSSFFSLEDYYFALLTGMARMLHVYMFIS